MAELVVIGYPAPRLSGRPYALDSIVGAQGREAAAAVVQAFLPGQLGGTALARILSGTVNESGRLPVSVPREPGSQPRPTSVRRWVVSAGQRVVEPGALERRSGASYEDVRSVVAPRLEGQERVVDLTRVVTCR